MSLEHTYNNLLARADDASPLSFEMQSRIWKHCLRRKDVAMAAKLAAYRQLDPRIDAEIKKHDNVETLRAWANRPERTAQELETRLLKDKRGTVAIYLATRRDLSSGSYVALAKLETQAVEEALAGNTAVPFAIRLAKIKKVVARTPRGTPHNHRERLQTMCFSADETETRALYEAVAETTLFLPYIKACAQSYYMRKNDMTRFCREIEAICLFGGTKLGDQWQPEHFGEFESLIETLLEYPLADSRDIANLKTLRRGIATTKTKLIDDMPGSTYVGKCTRGIEAIDWELSTLTGPFRVLIAATDRKRAVEAAQALRTTCTTKEQRANLAAQVAKHPHIPYRTGVQFAKWMTRTDTRLFVRRLEKVGDMDSLGDFFCKADADLSIDRDTLTYAERPQEILDAMVTHARKSKKMLPDWVVLTNIVDTNPADIVDMVQWDCVARNCNKSPELNICVEKTILNSLGNNDERWEAFNALSEDYVSSLRDLLAAACKLSA